MCVGGGYLIGDTTQTVEEGKNGTTVTAVASEGYRFIGWSDQFDLPTRKEKNVTENKELTAIFEEIKCSFYSDGALVRSLTLNEIAASDVTKLVAYKTNAQFVKWTFKDNAVLQQFKGNAVDYLQTTMLGVGIKDVPDFTVIAEFKDLQPPYSQSNFKTIAHALGGVNSKNYLNSKEAFEESYKKGFKFFEADISATTDGQMVLTHGGSVNYTFEEFMSNKTADKTPMSLADLFDYMTTYPEIWVDLDTLGFSKEQFERFIEYVQSELQSRENNLVDRIIIEVKDNTKYLIPDLEEVGMKNFLYTTWDTNDLSEIENTCMICEENGIKFASITCNRLLSWGAEGVEILKSHGISVLAYTTSDLATMYALYDIGVDCIFTDFSFI